MFIATGKGAHLRRYCDVHYVGNTAQGKHLAENGSCVHCGRKIPSMRRRGAKYCSDECKIKAGRLRREEQLIKQAQIDDVPVGESKILLKRHGPVYAELKRRPELLRQLLEGSMTQHEGAVILKTTDASMSRSLAAHRYDVAKAVKADTWEMLPQNKAMVPASLLDRLTDIGESHPHVEGLVAECAAAFWEFESKFFTVGSKQKPFIVKPFHREIIDGMIRAYAFGSRLLVLTPPRHGKSELMIRFVAWLIVMYPNIQILWVAANKDLAGQMTSKLKGTFEHNKKLRIAFLPPKAKYGDKGCSLWSKAEFTLYTRTDHTLKSPTFTGLGSTSTVAGRDADFIGVDDLEERKTVATPELREKSRTKHAEIMERQEDHTGVVTIGSRQHPDDIPNHLMDQEGDDAWEILVYPAHDDIGCETDPDDYKGHVECMLMPKIRSYKWLMAMESEAIALGLPGRFPLRYQQEPVPEEGIVFDIPLIKEKCLDRSRGLGMEGLPPMRLVAGLDPAARGTQVGFLWGWDGVTLHMIRRRDESRRNDEPVGRQVRLEALVPRRQLGTDRRLALRPRIPQRTDRTQPHRQASHDGDEQARPRIRGLFDGDLVPPGQDQPAVWNRRGEAQDEASAHPVAKLDVGRFLEAGQDGHQDGSLAAVPHETNRRILESPR